MVKKTRRSKSPTSWRKHYSKEPISLKELQEFLLKIFIERELTSKHRPWKGITYHTGFNEDGTEYEYWNINGALTGRGGYEMFQKALNEQIKSYGADKTNTDYWRAE